MSTTTQRPATLELAPAKSSGASRGAGPAADRRVSFARRRGRPPLLSPEQVLSEIRAESNAGRLFRVHLEKPALYARARRLWGNWAAALRAAGLDPRQVLETARQRALETRRRKRGNGLL